MSRSTPEWIGRDDDERPPPRVRRRNYDKHGGQCYLCGTALVARQWHTDHIQSLINHGQNRESNLAPICEPCHAIKTGRDVAEKSRVNRKRNKHLGIKAKKRGGFRGWRKFDGTPVFADKHSS